MNNKLGSHMKGAIGDEREKHPQLFLDTLIELM